jgi:hypothetical protein
MTQYNLEAARAPVEMAAGELADLFKLSTVGTELAHRNDSRRNARQWMWKHYAGE